MAVTSRRAGKTTACGLHLLQTAYAHPKSVCLYITLARTNAKKIIWPMLLDLNREHGLQGQANQSDLSLAFPNGSIIYCSGAATAIEIDRFRGLALKLVYVDEAQSFGSYLNQLIDDVLVPACFDNRGAIRLIGTPGPVPVGYYYEAYSSSNWSHHAWTMFDNPWILKKRGETPELVLEQELARRGVTELDPTIQREIFGRFVVDKAKLVFAYDAAINHYEELPKATYDYIIGIDLGYEDADALAVLAFTNASPVTYLVDEVVTPQQGLTELINQVQALIKKYNPVKIVIDTGGGGKKMAEEMRRRYSIPLHPTDKARKIETIELFNDAMRTKKFMANKNSRFANDILHIEWDFDKSTPERKVISDRFHSDISDACLYAWRHSPAFGWQTPKAKPKYQTPQWFKDEEEEMERQTLERLTIEQEPDALDWL